MQPQKQDWKKENPTTGFSTPNGYIESFTQNLMSQLPEKPKVEAPSRIVSMWNSVRSWVYLAAMMAGIALMVKMFTPQTVKENTLAQKSSETEPIDDYEIIDAYLTYTALNDYQIFETLETTDL